MNALGLSRPTIKAATSPVAGWRVTQKTPCRHRPPIWSWNALWTELHLPICLFILLQTSLFFGLLNLHANGPLFIYADDRSDICLQFKGIHRWVSRGLCSASDQAVSAIRAWSLTPDFHGPSHWICNSLSYCDRPRIRPANCPTRGLTSSAHSRKAPHRRCAMDDLGLLRHCRHREPGPGGLPVAFIQSGRMDAKLDSG